MLATCSKGIGYLVSRPPLNTYQGYHKHCLRSFVMQVANNIYDMPKKFSQGGVRANAQCSCCTLQATTTNGMLGLSESRQYKSRNGAETNKLVEAAERCAISKPPHKSTLS